MSSKLFPELDRLPNKKARREAWSVATGTVGTSWRYWAAIFGGCGPISSDSVLPSASWYSNGLARDGAVAGRSRHGDGLLGDHLGFQDRDSAYTLARADGSRHSLLRILRL